MTKSEYSVSMSSGISPPKSAPVTYFLRRKSPKWRRRFLAKLHPSNSTKQSGNSKLCEGSYPLVTKPISHLFSYFQTENSLHLIDLILCSIAHALIGKQQSSSHRELDNHECILGLTVWIKGCLHGRVFTWTIEVMAFGFIMPVQQCIWQWKAGTISEHIIIIFYYLYHLLVFHQEEDIGWVWEMAVTVSLCLFQPKSDTKLIQSFVTLSQEAGAACILHCIKF